MIPIEQFRFVHHGAEVHARAYWNADGSIRHIDIENIYYDDQDILPLQDKFCDFERMLRIKMIREARIMARKHLIRGTQHSTYDIDFL
jgi:hypothetical protein